MTIDCRQHARIIDRLVLRADPRLIPAGRIVTCRLEQTVWHHVDGRREIMVDERVRGRTGWTCTHWLTEEGQVRLSAHLIDVA